MGRGCLRRVEDGWIGDWRDASGARHRKLLAARREDAEKILAKHIRDRDLEMAGMGGERGGDLPIEELVREYLAGLAARAKPRTVAESRVSLERTLRELGARRARELTKASVTVWRERRLAAGASNKTANNAIATLKAMLNYAVRMGRLGVSPLNGLEGLPITEDFQRRKARALSDWEVVRLLTAAVDIDRRSGGIPREPLLRALVLTGARWGELTLTTWADLDLASGVLRFRAENTKGRRERFIPLERGLLARIAELPGELSRTHDGRRPSPGDRIFLTPHGQPWSRDTANFRRYLRMVSKRAGVDLVDASARRVHVHAFRHTFATRGARNGIPPAVMKDLLGHSTIEMTMRFYTHLGMEDWRKWVQGLPTLGVGGTLEPLAADRSPTDREDAENKAVSAQTLVP